VSLKWARRKDAPAWDQTPDPIPHPFQRCDLRRTRR